MNGSDWIIRRVYVRSYKKYGKHGIHDYFSFVETGVPDIGDGLLNDAISKMSNNNRFYSLPIEISGELGRKAWYYGSEINIQKAREIFIDQANSSRMKMKFKERTHMHYSYEGYDGPGSGYIVPVAWLAVGFDKEYPWLLFSSKDIADEWCCRIGVDD